MSDHVFLYVIVTVEVEAHAGVPLAGFTPGWAIGDVLVEQADHGPEWMFGPEDSVATVTVAAVKVGGRVQLNDGDVSYSRALARLLALIQLGANGERVLEARLQTFSEDVREQVVEEGNAVQAFRLTELTKKYVRR